MHIYGLYAAVCTPSCSLTYEDAERLAHGLVNARNSSAVTGNSDDRLQVMAEAVASEHTHELLRIAEGSDTFITEAVSAALEHVPSTLRWARSESTACFHARDAHHLYSINLLNGTVLLDGYPPRQLPVTISDHELYRRTFGTAAFEVSRDAFGAFRTSRPVDGCFYEFQELPCGRLRVIEIQEGSSP